MNVRITVSQDMYCFKEMFPEIKLYDPEDKEPIDLLIFPGGEDVSLDYYLNDPDEIEMFKPMCGTNRRRDEQEKDIFDKLSRGTINVKKVFGVCRGAQFLNVMFGGTLYPDLEHYGNGHPGEHDLYHNMASGLYFLKHVNSYHHQGIKMLGNYNKCTGSRVDRNMVATDLAGSVVEIAVWDNDKFLGVQFHPEYYSNTHPDKSKLVQVLTDWVDGKIKLVENMYR